MLNPIDMTGKRILITGASSGIGQGIAVLLCQLGAATVLVARSEEKLNKTREMLQGDHEIVPFDVSNLDEAENLMKMATANGKLDGYVHSAGINFTMPVGLMKHTDMHRLMLVNFYSFVELSKHFSKKKYNNDGGSIVGISSTASKVGNKGLCAYCASKSAMDSSVRVMSQEFAPKKIRVNSVCPSWIETEMYSELEKIIDEKAFEKLLDRQPLGLGKPVDVANAVAFLLSDAAKFITGTSMIVDGGYLS